MERDGGGGGGGRRRVHAYPADRLTNARTLQTPESLAAQSLRSIVSLAAGDG